MQPGVQGHQQLNSSEAAEEGEKKRSTFIAPSAHTQAQGLTGEIPDLDKNEQNNTVTLLSRQP